MNKLNKIKEIIKKFYPLADNGIFNCSSIFGTPVDVVYDENDITININFDYAFIEVLGLADNEFKELKDFYNDLK